MGLLKKGQGLAPESGYMGASSCSRLQKGGYGCGVWAPFKELLGDIGHIRGMLEDGCRVIYACFRSLGFGIKGPSYSNFLASTVWPQ